MSEPTETDDIEQRGALCRDCNHRAIWHHDERGCQFHGNGPNRCYCASSSDAVVSRLIAHNLIGYAERERPSIKVDLTNDESRWLLDAAVTEAGARAWDEGYAINAPRPDTNPTPNPYRDHLTRPVTSGGDDQ